MLCGPFIFVLLPVQTKCHIGQFQEPIAFSWLNDGKVPIALARGLFEAERGSNPKFALATDGFAVLSLLGFLCHCCNSLWVMGTRRSSPLDDWLRVRILRVAFGCKHLNQPLIWRSPLPKSCGWFVNFTRMRHLRLEFHK